MYSVDAQAINEALKTFKTALPDSAAMFFSHDDKSVSCLSYVPKVCNLFFLNHCRSFLLIAMIMACLHHVFSLCSL